MEPPQGGPGCPFPGSTAPFGTDSRLATLAGYLRLFFMHGQGGLYEEEFRRSRLNRCSRRPARCRGVRVGPGSRPPRSRRTPRLRPHAQGLSRLERSRESGLSVVAGRAAAEIPRLWAPEAQAAERLLALAPRPSGTIDHQEREIW